MYLNRGAIKGFVQRFRWAWLAGCAGLTVAWYLVPGDSSGVLMLKNLILFLPWLMYAISVESKILSNKVMMYLSGISLELYLAQMVIFRVIEKAKCLYFLGHGWISFLTVWMVVVVGLIVFIEVWKKTYKLVIRKAHD